MMRLIRKSWIDVSSLDLTPEDALVLDTLKLRGS